MTETRSTSPRSSAGIVSVLLYQGSPRTGASVPRGVGPTASAVASSGSESSLHSPAPQTFAELISVASKASLASKGSKSQPTALGGTSRGSTATAQIADLLSVASPIFSNRRPDRRHAQTNWPGRLGSRNLTPLRPVQETRWRTWRNPGSSSGPGAATARIAGSPQDAGSGATALRGPHALRLGNLRERRTRGRDGGGRAQRVTSPREPRAARSPARGSRALSA